MTKIDLLDLTIPNIDWDQVKKKTNVSAIREAIAIKRFQHIMRLRNVDGETAEKVRGRISELEDLLRDLAD